MTNTQERGKLGTRRFDAQKERVETGPIQFGDDFLTVIEVISARRGTLYRVLCECGRERTYNETEILHRVKLELCCADCRRNTPPTDDTYFPGDLG